MCPTRTFHATFPSCSSSQEQQPCPVRSADPACHPRGTDPGHLRVVLPAEGARVRAPASVHSSSSVLLPGAHLLAVLRSLRRGNGTPKLHGRRPCRCTTALRHPMSVGGWRMVARKRMVILMVLVDFPVRLCAVFLLRLHLCICDNRIEREFALQCYLHLLVTEHMGLPCVVVRVRVPFLHSYQR